jgi:tetratricopeptide (TPR) repeat protein
MRRMSAPELSGPRDFFISYSQADRAWAEWIASQLEDAGHTLLLQGRDFAPGTNFAQWMHEAIVDQSTRTIAIISPDYLSSRFGRPEWSEAFARDPFAEHGTLIPIRVRDAELTGLLARVRYIDLVGLDEEAAKTALLKGLRRGRSKPDAPSFPSLERSALGRPRFPGSVSPVWNVPGRNAGFTGREKILSLLHSALLAEHSDVSVVGLTGLGGAGKTQLAIEYAYRFAAEYDVVWWINAEQPLSLLADFASLAKALNLSTRDDLDQRASVQVVHVWLKSHEKWLLIFDNVDDHQQVREYIPTTHAGHVIVTSRNAVLPSVAKSFPILGLDRDEAVAFLHRRIGADEPQAVDLARALGDLPLALEQAASYIENAGISIREYLDLFRRHEGELLHRGDASSGYEGSVATAWEVSFRQVERLSPSSADLLRLFAFLAPENISQSLFRRATDILPLPLSEVVAEDHAYYEALTTLRRYSLVQGTSDALSVHWLVQAVIRDQLAEDERTIWAAAAVRAIDSAFDESTGVHTDVEFAHLLPHALAAATYAESQSVALEVCASLLTRVGGALVRRGELTEGLSAFERALHISETTAGPDHPDVAAALNNIARVLQELGDLDGARANFERALRIYEAASDSERPNVAALSNNLARVLQSQGDLSGALVQFEQALRVSEVTFGREHPYTAILLSNIARVLQDVGRVSEARVYLEQALQFTEAALGAEHPVVVTLLNNLGLVLHELGEVHQARASLERALQITETAFGPDHPNVAVSLNNLANILRDVGELDAARLYLERALRIDEAIYGSGHLEVATDLGNLAGVLTELGDSAAARMHIERALQITEATFGSEHPRTAAYLALQRRLEAQVTGGTHE